MKMFDVQITFQGLVDDSATDLTGEELAEAVRQEIMEDFGDESILGLVVSVKEIK